MEQDILGSYMQRAEVEQRIIPVLVNTGQKREMLKEAVHREFLDLSMIYVIAPKEPSGVEGEYQIMTKNMAERMLFSEAELYSLAEKNGNRLLPVECIPMEAWMEHLMQNMGTSESLIREKIYPNKFSSSLYLLKNEKSCFGATVLIYQEPVRKLASRLEDNLFLLPSSIHEVIAVPESMGFSAEELAGIVRQVNREMVGPEEYLSDCVYYYDHNQRHLTLAQAEVQTAIESEERFRDNTRRKKGR